MIFKRIKIFFLSFFRELFVYHHKSLEFRAKIFAAIISSNSFDNERDYSNLKELAKEIYDDEYRVDILVNTAKEYVEKIDTNDSLTIDSLLLDIDKQIKYNPRFVSKINMNHLNRFFVPNNDENSEILQTRILEFFENQIKNYNLHVV